MSHSTAVAVLVDAITTIVGFGSLMIASHRGLQSLGRVLTIGVTCCMFTSLIMLPALLTWMSWNRKDEEEELTSSGEQVRHSAATEGIIWRRDDAESQNSPPHTGEPPPPECPCPQSDFVARKDRQRAVGRLRKKRDFGELESIELVEVSRVAAGGRQFAFEL